MSDQPIPKASTFFQGDINEAVIRVQQVTSIQISPEWWSKEVLDHGTADEILSRFDQAYQREVDRRKKA